ncbi:TlyA family RNA methyltransferase [Maritalea mediterranea]|uniref:TlyA family RNA methyltransferase n=1 Tax=Maritalea mediterranea TaxID=2909667 RepID=A0ABS9E4T9_9HYPH|nr:TlyA family RNA methyltransferase [Maritalea mediterranea]MCF4097880.1 TlyA family RNA methyltransferase [Maritalea mediterranea]
MRLDHYLDAHKLARSRARARDAIVRGCVTVNGKVVSKPGHKVDEADQVEIDDPSAPYVSRAALKLLAALNLSQLDVSGRVCLDLGASTGGFTQILLQHDAAKIYAVDVGQDQLADELKTAPQIINMEQTNATALTAENIPDPIDILVSDVSFVSLLKVIGPALDLCAPGAHALLLIKPQFEVGRAAIGKGGIVKDQSAITTARQRVDDFLSEHGWEKQGDTPSPISGGDGNQEFIHWYCKAG